MSNYKGLFTFDADGHKYVTVGEADGIITHMDYEPPEPAKPLIKDEKIREIIRSWAIVNYITELAYNYRENSLEDIFRNTITFNSKLDLKDGNSYTIDDLCGK